MNKSVRDNIILFVVMTIMGIVFNPMNMLAYRWSDLYLSTTLLYIGMLMGSNMLWGHQVVHGLQHGFQSVDMSVVIVGVLLSIGMIILLRSQIGVTPEQWMRRMIPHHSTALTTSTRLRDRYKDELPAGVLRLANNIIKTQEVEISEMKRMLQ